MTLHNLAGLPWPRPLHRGPWPSQGQRQDQRDVQVKGQHVTAGNWPKHIWSRRPGEVKVQDRGHVSFLLWGILLVLAWLSSDRFKLCHRGDAASSGHSHGAQAAQGPFLGKGSTGSFQSLTTLAQPCQRTPELSISQLLWDNIPFPFILPAQPQGPQQCWGSQPPPFPN